MANSNPPLFLHDGVYSAFLDRALIGSLLTASGMGNAPMVPRPGVRPHYVDNAGFETSLRVVATGSTIAVQPGAAFVKGANSDGISGVYLIICPTPLPIPLPPVTATAQTVTIAAMVIDSLGDPSPNPAEGSWRIGYYTGTAPANSLPLATVTVPANGGNLAAPVDKRVFASALGAAFLVPTVANLHADPLSHLPYGSQAYAWDTDMMYVRTKVGWVQNPAVATISNTVSNPAKGHQNELLWNTNQDILFIYDANKWVPISRRPTAVATMYETTWADGPDRAQTSSMDFNIEVPAGAYYSINHAKVKPYIADEIKPEPNSLMLKMLAHSPNAPVTVRMSAQVVINKKNDAGDGYEEDLGGNQFWIGVQIYGGNALTGTFNPTKPYPKDENDPEFSDIIEAQAIDEVKSSLTWTRYWNTQHLYFDMVTLAQGTYYIRPVFKANKLGWFQINNLFIEITSR